MKNMLFLVALVFCSNLCYGQVQNIVIDSLDEPEEPTIAIDPKKPAHMVAGSNITNFYTSTDSGRSWQNGRISSSYGVDGDPIVICDTTGAFYYFHLSSDGALPGFESLNRIVCQRMDDITSFSWTDGEYTGYVDTPAVADKPGVGVDRISNSLYVTWTKFDRYGSPDPTDSSSIYFSKSTDRGDTWSTALRINKTAGDCTDDDPTVEGAIPCAGPHGEIFVSWASYDAIMFDRSFDGGVTWVTDDIHVTDVPGGWNYHIPGIFRCNGLPFIACDLSSSPYRGNLYINWTDQRNGANNTDVWICRSADSGTTWSAPIKVNDDTGSSQQFMSSMAVDPATGYIYVLFYDRRDYTGNLLTDVSLAVSKDGAATFRNYKISETPFAPQQGTFVGDYTYISAFNSVVRPIWTRLNVTDSSSEQKVMTAIIDSSITGAVTGVAVTGTNALQNCMTIYPDPVYDWATISYYLAAQCRISLYITDLSGRQIAELKDNEPASAGNHSIQIRTSDYSLSPGLYFVTLRSTDFSQTRKLVVTR